MGLDVSHDAWNGAYSRFSRFRIALANTIGVDLHEMYGFRGKREWSSLPPHPLHVLLSHSDCAGTIDVEDLPSLAVALRTAAPLLPSEFTEHAIKFAEGCELAHSLNEPLEFH